MSRHRLALQIDNNFRAVCSTLKRRLFFSRILCIGLCNKCAITDVVLTCSPIIDSVYQEKYACRSNLTRKTIFAAICQQPCRE